VREGGYGGDGTTHVGTRIRCNGWEAGVHEGGRHGGNGSTHMGMHPRFSLDAAMEVGVHVQARALALIGQEVDTCTRVGAAVEMGTARGHAPSLKSVGKRAHT
jgi:hypothetical protein